MAGSRSQRGSHAQGQAFCGFLQEIVTRYPYIVVAKDVIFQYCPCCIGACPSSSVSAFYLPHPPSSSEMRLLSLLPKRPTLYMESVDEGSVVYHNVDREDDSMTWSREECKRRKTTPHEFVEAMLRVNKSCEKLNLVYGISMEIYSPYLEHRAAVSSLLHCPDNVRHVDFDAVLIDTRNGVNKPVAVIEEYSLKKPTYIMRAWSRFWGCPCLDIHTQDPNTLNGTVDIKVHYPHRALNTPVPSFTTYRELLDTWVAAHL